jgi:hypothetical protein
MVAPVRMEKTTGFLRSKRTSSSSTLWSGMSGAPTGGWYNARSKRRTGTKEEDGRG